MDENIKKVAEEIDALTTVKKALEQDVARLQKIHDNLDAQAHTQQVKDEQDDKLKDYEKLTKFHAIEQKIENDRIVAEGRITLAENMEEKVRAREREVELREQRTLDLDNKIQDLNRQRVNFEAYKRDIEQKLSDAHEVIAAASTAEEKLQVERDMLLGREMKVREQERYWNDCIGQLEADKKQFEIEKENFLGLNKVKEEVNV